MRDSLTQVKFKAAWSQSMGTLLIYSHTSLLRSPGASSNTHRSTTNAILPKRGHRCQWSATELILTDSPLYLPLYLLLSNKRWVWASPFPPLLLIYFHNYCLFRLQSHLDVKVQCFSAWFYDKRPKLVFWTFKFKNQTMARETDLTYYITNKIKMVGFCILITISDMLC